MFVTDERHILCAISFHTINLKKIAEQRFPDHTGIFTAEIAALKYAINKGSKSLICTDSLSVIKALKNVQ